MPISCLSPWRFEDRSSFWAVVEKWAGEGMDWFADDEENIVGIIVHTGDMKRWGYVLFGRAERGEFGLLDLRMNLQSWRSAETNLLLAMTHAESIRQEILAQQRLYNWPQ